MSYPFNNKKLNVDLNVPILGLLGVVFVTLKLCNVIEWSWWWVTAPFWGPLVLAIVALAVLGLLKLIIK
jgi:hypothetical protein